MKYVVLPAGHGKSYNHNGNIGLWEADQVINCKATPELRALRKEAKTTGDFTKYDQLWGAEIAKRLPTNSVLMVPHSSVGIQAGGTECLGGFLLDPATWAKNLKARGETSDKYQWGYDSVQKDTIASAKIYKTNEALQEALMETVTPHLPPKRLDPSYT